VARADRRPAAAVQERRRRRRGAGDPDGRRSANSHGRSAAGNAPGSSTPAANQPQRDPTVPGGHVGANGKTEAAHAPDVATKVKAAAEAKVPGGTVERVETDVDHGSPYEAHVKKADGTELEVLVDSSFKVTAVNAMGHR
jgi:hypothetical protein